MNTPGLVVVLTGPSGAGKSSVIKAVLEREPGLSFSVSHTTRPPRAHEREGVDYRFVSREEFEKMRGEGGFLEWAEVHDHLYGTSFAEIESACSAGKEILLDIDVQGAAQVGARLARATSIFLLPPDYATLEARLRGRRSETEVQIGVRLRTAAEEVRRYREFGYLVINDSVEGTVGGVCAILAAERLRTDRRREIAERILTTFPDPGTGRSGAQGSGGSGAPFPPPGRAF